MEVGGSSGFESEFKFSEGITSIASWRNEGRNCYLFVKELIVW
jgi:hypothetical protein